MQGEELTTIVTSSPMDLLVYAWLDAKFHKSTSEKTRKTYADIMRQFRGMLSTQGLDLDSDPGSIALIAQAYAGSSTRGKQVASATYNQRLAVLSSFYEYARKRRALTNNPIETVDRATVQAYASAQPLDSESVAFSLEQIDQTTISGKRDYALLSILFQTGRRAQEVSGLTWGDIQIHKGQATLTFQTKGGKTMIDTLPPAVTDALLRWLHGHYGRALSKLETETPLWVSLARDQSRGKQLSYGAINALCKKHLGTSKVHTTRHTFAHMMEQIGAPVSEIQARLGHGSLSTTGRYLASLKRAENLHGQQLAALLGIK